MRRLIGEDHREETSDDVDDGDGENQTADGEQQRLAGVQLGARAKPFDDEKEHKEQIGNENKRVEISNSMRTRQRKEMNTKFSP